MASIGSLTVDLTMEAANFIAASKAAAAASESASKRIEAAMDLAKEATTAFIGAWSIERVAEMIDQSFEFGAKMIDLSNKTGLTTTAIQEFTFAVKQNGGSTDEASAALNKFSVNVGKAQDGNQKMSKALSAVGVKSWTSVTDALQQYEAGLGKLDTQQEKNASVTVLMGKGAGAVAAAAMKGAEAFKELADEAEGYGIVLDREVLQQGKEAEDKISALKQVLAADISNAVLTNADSIAKFADGLLNLVMVVPKIINSLSELKTYFAELTLELPAWMKSGYDFKKGFVGASEANAQSEHNILGSHDGRQWLYTKSKKESEAAYASGDAATGKALHNKAVWTAAYDKQMRNQKPMGEVDSGGAGSVTPPKTRQKKEHEVDPKYFDNKYTQATNELDSALLALATAADERYKIQIDMLDSEKTNKDKAINDDKKLTDSQKATLIAMNDNTIALKEQAIDNAKFDKFTQDQADLDIQLRSYKEDQLNSDLALATTAKQRQKIQLDLLAAETEDKRVKLQAVKDKIGSTPEEKRAAQNGLDHLPTQQANAAKLIQKQNQGPLADYMDSISKAGDKMNESLQGVEVNGLKSLEDGLLGVVEGTESVGQAFSKMALGIVEDLAKIEIEKEILGPLSNALFGGGGGFLSGLFGGGSNFAAPTSIGIAGFDPLNVNGARANGGMTDPGNYLVGERGPELVSIGANANVETNRQLQASANDNSGGHSFTFGPGAIVSNDPERVRQMVIEGIATAIPTITKQSTDATLKRLGRRTVG